MNSLIRRNEKQSEFCVYITYSTGAKNTNCTDEKVLLTPRVFSANHLLADVNKENKNI